MQKWISHKYFNHTSQAFNFFKHCKEIYAKIQEQNLPDVQQPQATQILVKTWKFTDVRQSVILLQALFSFP